RTGATHQHVPLSTLRWDAPAGDDRHGDRPPTADPDRGRADHRRRRDTAAPGPGPVAGPAQRWALPDHDHPRPRRGPVLLRRRSGDAPWPGGGEGVDEDLRPGGDRAIL